MKTLPSYHFIKLLLAIASVVLVMAHYGQPQAQPLAEPEQQLQAQPSLRLSTEPPAEITVETNAQPSETPVEKSTQSAEKEFTDEQQEHLTQITQYLNGLKNFESRIRQISSADSGSDLYGMLYVSRPGKMRLDYFPPEATQLFASSKQFTLVDTSTDTSTIYPFFTTPASLLLEEKIDLNNKKIKILDIENIGSRLVLTIAPKHDEEDVEDVGKMILIFSETPVSLLGWHVIDANNSRISVILDKIKNNVKFTKPNFFYYEKNKY